MVRMKTAIQKVLLVAKKSAYQTYFKEYRRGSVRDLARTGDEGLRHIRRSHDTHYASLQKVQESLKECGIRHDLRFRGEKIRAAGYDLVIAVGGDGTFLDASHAITHERILGVNSDVTHSVGNFCSVSGQDFPSALIEILSGRYSISKLHRLQVLLNGKSYIFSILNDILVCHASPAAMSHYELQIGGVREKQRSSGLWISTAAGSTAAIHSAGAKTLNRFSPNVQYLPRELFSGHGPRYRLRGGVLPKNKKISVLSQMGEGIVYLDGAHHHLAFGYGDLLEVRQAAPLHLLVPSSK